MFYYNTLFFNKQIVESLSKIARIDKKKLIKVIFLTIK